jgi:hypothetical protein
MNLLQTKRQQSQAPPIIKEPILKGLYKLWPVSASSDNYEFVTNKETAKSGSSNHQRTNLERSLQVVTGFGFFRQLVKTKRQQRLLQSSKNQSWKVFTSCDRFRLLQYEFVKTKRQQSQAPPRSKNQSWKVFTSCDRFRLLQTPLNLKTKRQQSQAPPIIKEPILKGLYKLWPVSASSDNYEIVKTKGSSKHQRTNLERSLQVVTGFGFFRQLWIC